MVMLTLPFQYADDIKCHHGQHLVEGHQLRFRSYTTFLLLQQGAGAKALRTYLAEWD
jgi:hypothetical protein